MLPHTGRDYIAAFNPKEYLQECYDGPDHEHIFNIEFLVEALQLLPTNLRVLEVGSGPTLHSVAAIAPHANEIHLADYVPANLDEIFLWLDHRPEAFNWHPFIEVALTKAGLPATPEAVEQRAAEMRDKVTRLLVCDVLQPEPLEEKSEPYDLVLAPHCTDVAATTLQQWFQVMQNVTTLVKPRGWLFIAVTTGTTHNTVGTRVFNCVDLTDDDIYQGYVQAGYDPNTYMIAKIPADHKYEFTGICYAIAQKLPLQNVNLPTTLPDSKNSLNSINSTNSP